MQRQYIEEIEQSVAGYPPQGVGSPEPCRSNLHAHGNIYSAGRRKVMSGGAQNTVTARKIVIFTTMCPRAEKHMVKMRAKPIRGGLTAPKPPFMAYFCQFRAYTGQNPWKFEQWATPYGAQVAQTTRPCYDPRKRPNHPTPHCAPSGGP